MSVLTANCPSCAGPVEFKAGSTIVVVCPFCRSVVARTDRGVDDLGKVAEIVETQSPLKIGLKGKYLDNGFELTGRAQLKHEAGGVWDEWYATFSNGWVGWLAEAQGKFYITFYQPLSGGASVPDYAVLQAGGSVTLGDKTYTVAEKGMATAIAAEGEIPYQLKPNETSYFADLSGAKGAFATIDYGLNPPWTFVGAEVTLDQIGLGTARPAERKARTVAAKGLGCPNCGGPIELRAPDAAERVTCPNCDSLLDVQQGNFKYLTTLKPQGEAYLLEIGSVAQFPDKEPMQVIGAVTRSVNIDGIKYFWQEYLLYTPKIGFRWLIQDDYQWSFVEPVAAGDVMELGLSINAKGATAQYDGEGAAKGKTFRLFQYAVAVVEHVKGEFYWRVQVGDAAASSDYVSAPFMLSKESSLDGKEVNWSIGTYLPRQTVQKAFNLEIALPTPYNVAPNQPFAHLDLMWYSLALIALLFIASIVLLPLSGGRGSVGNYSFSLPPMANARAQQVAFSQPFDLKGNRNVKISANVPVNNSWASLDVDLVNEASNKLESVPLDIEYYNGRDTDGAWSEGSTSNSAVLSSVPAGKYTMRVAGTWGNWQQPQTVNVRVEQNVSRVTNFFCALILLSIMPIFVLIWYATFESRRWGQSMFASTGS